MARLDPDYALQLYMASFIHRRGIKHSLGYRPHRFRSGQPLKLLLAGYVGSRNTGADVRVEEMIRQFQHLLPHQLQLSILTLDPQLTQGYFKGVEQLHLPQIFPKFLYQQCARHHGVIACEGSMFKSKFANALTVMMAGALGLANAEHKLSVGYGAEAGDMDLELEHFVRKTCDRSLIICRNEASRQRLQQLNIRHQGGTDTAWTFEPAPASFSHQQLRQLGWDGQQPILMICPINPFWWPVKPSLTKALRKSLGRGSDRHTHYKSIYFHANSLQKRQQYHNYLAALAQSAKTFAQRHNAFVALVAMEKLDNLACQDFISYYGQTLPVCSSQDYNMFELVSLLRQASLLVSSRFHAIVTSMPGLVASVGVTMDERIRNLMIERGHTRYLLDVDDSHLQQRLIELMTEAFESRQQLADDIGRSIPKQLKAMANMGQSFLQEVSRVYPSIEPPLQATHWQHYLPPLSANLQSLLTRYT